MRTNILTDLVTTLRLRDYPYNIIFSEPPKSGECDMETQYNNNGVTAVYEYEFGDLFINGLSQKEQSALYNMI